MQYGQCKLCLQNKNLAESHMMPRALYESCQMPGIDPILISEDVVMPATRHVKDYLLCSDCEKLLNRDGENWVLPKLVTKERDFPLYATLVSAGPILVDSEITVYSGAESHQIDVGSVINFGIGL